MRRSCSPFGLTPTYNHHAKSDIPIVISIRLDICERSSSKVTPNANILFYDMSSRIDGIVTIIDIDTAVATQPDRVSSTVMSIFFDFLEIISRNQDTHISLLPLHFHCELLYTACSYFGKNLVYLHFRQLCYLGSHSMSSASRSCSVTEIICFWLNYVTRYCR